MVANQSDRRPLELVLLEGRFDGPIKVGVKRRTYHLYIIPRGSIPFWRRDTEVNRPGVYMMIEDLSVPKPRMYVGQAALRANGNGALGRVAEHLDRREHTWCHTAILLVADPESFGATELNWLEHTFLNLAITAGYTTPVNGLNPSPGHVPVEIANDLQSTLADARLMIATMRYPVLEPALPSDPHTTASTDKTLEHLTEPKRGATSQDFYLRMRGFSVPAVMVKSADYWVLRAGSPVKDRYEITDRQAAKLREAYADMIYGGLTSADLIFASPSAAARFVIGKASNGRTAWKTADGTTLGEVQDLGMVS